MSLVNLSRAYEAMRDALTDAQIAAGMKGVALGAEQAKRIHAEETLIRAVSRAKRAEEELDELKDLLVQAVMLRQLAACEWLVSVAEERAGLHRE